ncbi:MAG: hypothetical protein QOH50_1876 [Kribbellaceae bacterium]|jgi:hypothetical protein|nr:hypothetical protein [Kribbellaceae bacterium]
MTDNGETAGPPTGCLRSGRRFVLSIRQESAAQTAGSGGTRG